MQFDYNRQYFAHRQVEDFLEYGYAVDGSEGGIILGESHNNGGVKVLFEYDDGYRLVAEVEGGEYILNGGSSCEFFEWLIHVNNPKQDKGKYEPIVDAKHNVIDCRPNVVGGLQKFLVFDIRVRHFIVNKYSTSRHIEILNRLNSLIRYQPSGKMYKWDDCWDKDHFAFPNNMQRQFKDSDFDPILIFELNQIKAQSGKAF
jgi:hypothetical protein